MDINLNGVNIRSERDFHKALATTLGACGIYGSNLDALWDLLSASVERPLKLLWANHEASKNTMGADFDRVIEVLERVKLQDEQYGWKERFSYSLN